MRAFTPRMLVEATPWVFFAVGVTLTIAMLVGWLSLGLWTVWRSHLCFGGAALAIVGGATLQLRQDCRARAETARRPLP